MRFKKIKNEAKQTIERRINMYKKLKEQSGSALLVTLSILIMLSILGIASIKVSTTDMDISYNNKAKSMSFFAAEAGLSHTLTTISNGTSTSAGTISITQLGNGTSYATSWTAVDLANTMTLTSTGYKGNSASPDGKTVLQQKIELTDVSLDNAITIPNWGLPPGSEGPFKIDGSSRQNQVYGKIQIDAPVGTNGKQVMVDNLATNPVKFAGVVNVTIGGIPYYAKVNNPTNDGTPHQFTITISGTNYTGTVTWDNASTPKTGTGSISISGTTYTGVAKPGSISITGGSSAYTGPPTSSGNLGWLYLNQPVQTPPDLGSTTIQTLGTNGATAGGYTAPVSAVTFGSSNLTLNKVGGGTISYYDGATKTIDFTAIPGGILYLPAGFSLGQGVFYKGLGTIVTGSGTVYINKNLKPATGFELTSDLGLVSNGQVELQGGATSIYVYAHIFTMGTNQNVIEPGVNFYGSFVAPFLKMEGTDDPNNITRIYYMKPKGSIPGLAYLSSKFVVSAQKGSWMEELN